MIHQDRGPSAWEQCLLGVIRSEVEQLRYLIENQSGDTELPDVHAQVSRLGGLTDLVFAEGLGLSTSSRAAIESLADEAGEVVRSTIEFSRPSLDRQLEIERQAANALYDAILLNLPYLAEGDSSQHGFALSKEAFASLQRESPLVS